MLLAVGFRRQVEKLERDYPGVQVKVAVSLGAAGLGDDGTWVEQFLTGRTRAEVTDHAKGKQTDLLSGL